MKQKYKNKNEVKKMLFFTCSGIKNVVEGCGKSPLLNYRPQNSMSDFLSGYCES